MSAADLFRDRYDVEFRLKNTYIVVGRKPFRVKDVGCLGFDGTSVSSTALYLQDIKNNITEVLLRRLPLSSMMRCPWGYYQGCWVARGPARNRFQGITGTSFWRVSAEGDATALGAVDAGDVLEQITPQPAIRALELIPRNEYDAEAVLTRDVMVDMGRVYLRGRLMGRMIEPDVIETRVQMTDLMKQLLANARLRVWDKEAA